MNYLLFTWISDHQERPDAVKPFVRRCGLKSVTDRLYTCYHADTDVEWIQPNLSFRVATNIFYFIVSLCCRPISYFHFLPVCYALLLLCGLMFVNLTCFIVLKAGPILSSLAFIRKLYNIPGGAAVIWIVKKFYAQFALGYGLVSYSLYSFENYGAVIIKMLLFIVWTQHSKEQTSPC